MNVDEEEIFEENEEIIRDVKISFLGTTSSFMTEQYKPSLKFKYRINKAQLKNLKVQHSLSPIKKDGIEEEVNEEGKPSIMSGEFSDIDPNLNFN